MRLGRVCNIWLKMGHFWECFVLKDKGARPIARKKIHCILVSWHKKDNISMDLLKPEIVSGSGIRWAI